MNKMKTIVVAGATGNLGQKIVSALVTSGANVRVIVRNGSNENIINRLKSIGAVIHQVKNWERNELAEACKEANCVVSALAGLNDVIIHAQKELLDGAVDAGVDRFIPSDFSLDFTGLKEGGNRNFDLRREFHQQIDESSIRVTSIYNGPFMELLTGEMPMILFKQKRILCWGDPEQLIDFTLTDNIAAFTAHAAMDSSAPRSLYIAGDRINCNQLSQIVSEITGTPFKLFRPGGIRLLKLLITITKFFQPAKKELYPAWQGMQYMKDMMEGLVHIQEYHNNRYPELKWTSVTEFLRSEKEKSIF